MPSVGRTRADGRRSGPDRRGTYFAFQGLLMRC